MKKSELLMNLLIQDKLIRFNLDLLEGLLRELRSDIEESKILVEACLEGQDRQSILKSLADFEEEFTNLISEALDQIYDLYEVFNFDITFLSTIPEELEREIERLDTVSSINRSLEILKRQLENLLSKSEWDEGTKAIFTPLRVYKEVLEHAISFNQKLGDSLYYTL